MDRMTSKHRLFSLALGAAMVAATVAAAPAADAAGRRDVRADRRAEAVDDRRDRSTPARWIEDRRGQRKAVPARRPARQVLVRRPAPHRPVIVHRPAPHRPVIIHRPAPHRPVVVHRPAPWRGYHHPKDRRRHFVYRDRRGNEVAAAIIGFGLGFVAKAIIDDHHQVVPEKVVYVPESDAAALDDGGPVRCLQTREYQTTIEIDGIAREAYGTACLQPDGAWLMGAPEPVDDYEDYNG